LPPWNAWRTNTKLNSGSADNKVPWSCCAHDAFGKATECDSKNPVIYRFSFILLSGHFIATSLVFQVVLDEIYRNDCFDSGLSFVNDHASILATLSVIAATIMVKYFETTTKN